MVGGFNFYGNRRVAFSFVDGQRHAVPTRLRFPDSMNVEIRNDDYFSSYSPLLAQYSLLLGKDFKFRNNDWFVVPKNMAGPDLVVYSVRISCEAHT